MGDAGRQLALVTLQTLSHVPTAISAMRASSAIGLHREIFFGGGNLTNSSPGRNRSGSSLGTPRRAHPDARLRGVARGRDGDIREKLAARMKESPGMPR